MTLSAWLLIPSSSSSPSLSSSSSSSSLLLFLLILLFFRPSPLLSLLSFTPLHFHSKPRHLGLPPPFPPIAVVDLAPSSPFLLHPALLSIVHLPKEDVVCFRHRIERCGSARLGASRIPLCGRSVSGIGIGRVWGRFGWRGEGFSAAAAVTALLETGWAGKLLALVCCWESE